MLGETQREAQVDEHRAAVLMGMSPADLRRLAQQASLGHSQESGMVFTYEELRRLSLLAARPSE
jgi:hypothetical protein